MVNSKYSISAKHTIPIGIPCRDAAAQAWDGILRLCGPCRLIKQMRPAALAEFHGKIEGLMLFRILGEEVTKYNFAAYRFYYQPAGHDT